MKGLYLPVNDTPTKLNYIPNWMKFFLPQSSSSQPPTIRIGESIISLLLKLHSQLSGMPDSFNLDSVASTSEAENSDRPESRIGDGPYFIGQLLKKIAKLDPMCRNSIVETKNKLWPRMQECEDEQRERELREKEERRRRAKEHQQKVMEDFANKQRQFMEKAMETGLAFHVQLNVDSGKLNLIC